jgi:CBS domain containing-hemolysin-like protein
MTGQDILSRLLSVFFLIALNAFFVSAEFSLVSVRRSRISQLVAAGDIQAQTVQSLQRSIARLLSTTQLGITLSSLALGWIADSTMALMFHELISALPLSVRVRESISQVLAVPLAFFLIAYLQIVLGELCPKALALLYPEELSRFLGVPVGAIARIFQPFIWILNQSTRFLLGLVGIDYTDSAWDRRVTLEELRLIITTEGESTGLEAQERKLLNNLLECGTMTAEEVMINRTRLVALPQSVTFGELLKEVSRTGYTRYPIKGESVDDIQGIIDFKDLAVVLEQGELTPDTFLYPWVKPVHFVPKSTSLTELLSLMQRAHEKMVMVVDEFGGICGLVTRHDVIGEIFGDVPEATGSETIMLQMLDEQTFLVQAQMEIEEVNAVLELSLPVSDKYQTLGGFVLYQWQKVPTAGETLDYNNLEFTIVSVTGPRLGYIQIHRKN